MRIVHERREISGSSSDMGMQEAVSSGDLFRILRRRLVKELEDRRDCPDEDIWTIIDELVLEEGGGSRLNLREKEQLRNDLFCSVRKLDILQELIDDPDITEIMVNGYQSVFYEKAGCIYPWNRKFSSQERLEDVIQNIAGRCNRVVNEQRPIVDARLEDGARVNVVMNPIALNGPILTIRRFPEEPIAMQDLVESGSLTEEAAAFLRDAVEARYSILIGGGTSTGKTTFLNALSAFIPKGERIITIEDNAELQIQGVDNLVRLEARDVNLEGTHEVTIRDLIKSALRMRPSRIVVGEVRGAEAEDFLIVLNTGHSGSLGTAHANSVRDMIGRLEMMVLMGVALPVPVIRRQIASGVELFVHLSREYDGRRVVSEIAETEGMDGENVAIRTLFLRGEDPQLRKVHDLIHTGKMNQLYERRKKESESD